MAVDFMEEEGASTAEAAASMEAVDLAVDARSMAEEATEVPAHSTAAGFTATAFAVAGADMAGAVEGGVAEVGVGEEDGAGVGD